MSNLKYCVLPNANPVNVMYIWFMLQKNSMYKEFRGKEIKHEPRSRGLHSFPDHFREPKINF